MNKNLIKKGGALFLTLFLFLFSFLPLNAYALDGAGSGAVSGAAQNSLEWGVSLGDGSTSIYDGPHGLGGYSSTIKQKYCQEIITYVNFYGSYSSDKVLSLELPIRPGRYKNFKANLSIYDFSNGKQYLSGYSYDINYGIDNSEYSYKTKGDFKTVTFKNLELKSDISSRLQFYIVFTDFEYVGATSGDADFYFGYNQFYLYQNNKSDGFFNSIIEWLKDIVNRIKELPQSIGNFINSLGDKISGFFTNLINKLKTWFDNIGQWFTDLGNNIKQWFTNLTNNLKQWFDNIGKWFTDLGNNIKSWFNTLFNKLWWGNEQGESAYEPPVFSSGVTDVLDKIQEYIDSLDDTLNQIDNASNSVSSQIKQATNVVNSVLGVAPSAVIALITFGIVFIFSRKVVGR